MKVCMTQRLTRDDGGLERAGRFGGGRQSNRAGLVRALALAGALCLAAFADAGGADWPMWRYDAARSADTPVELAEELHLQWVRELPEPQRAWPFQWDDRGKLDFDVSYTPVVKGERIFVPSNVTDSVTAYHIEDGRELWRFYADGPVRLAPAAWRGRVYLTSDDGHLYCVDAETGELDWKFRAGPSDQRLLGNERIINFWAARGGPVADDGTVYFAAGVVPLHGVFIYALDAATGEVEWVNDRLGAQSVRVPRGGVRGGISPQGYLAVEGDRVIVSGGRAGHMVLDRHTGELISTRFDISKGAGGYAVHARGVGMRTSAMLRDRVESVADQIKGNVTVATSRVRNHYSASKMDDDPDATHVFYKLGARGRLFLTTEDGRLYCFGPDEVEPRKYGYDPEPLESARGEWADTAAKISEEADRLDGYGLMLGAGSGELLRGLLAETDVHIVVVEADGSTVRALRDELVDAGLYGRRAAVIEADPAAFRAQPYLFGLVVSEDVSAAGLAAEPESMSSLLDLLTPYTGRAWLGAGDAETAAALAGAGSKAEVDQVAVKAQDKSVRARRDGPLTGAGQWTHNYHGPAQTHLHFAELDEGVEAGDRVFDVYLDGEKVLEGFDIVGRTGAPLRGVVETFEVDVNGGLAVELRRAGDSQRDPVISGVDVTQL